MVVPVATSYIFSAGVTVCLATALWCLCRTGLRLCANMFAEPMIRNIDRIAIEYLKFKSLFIFFTPLLSQSHRSPLNRAVYSGSRFDFENPEIVVHYNRIRGPAHHAKTVVFKPDNKFANFFETEAY